MSTDYGLRPAPIARAGNQVYLCAPAYQLGEISEPVTSISDLASRAAEFTMPMLGKLWGWGEYRRTELDLEDLAIATARATVAEAGVEAASIDALIVCSTKFPGGAESHGRFVQRITDAVGLTGTAFYGLTLHRCANLLAAIDLAATLITAGRHRRILVITTDRVRPGVSRVEQYAIFSDGSASCLVTDAPVRGANYEILGAAFANSPGGLDAGTEISADLAVEVNGRLLDHLPLELSEVRALMHANLVVPVVSMKERQAGFGPKQLYLDNISRFGHCFAADPVINLVDREALGQLRAGDHVLLATSVPGERFSVLLRCETVEASDHALTTV